MTKTTAGDEQWLGAPSKRTTHDNQPSTADDDAGRQHNTLTIRNNQPTMMIRREVARRHHCRPLVVGRSSLRRRCTNRGDPKLWAFG